MEPRQSSRNVFDAMGPFWAEIADKDQTQRQINFLESTLPHDSTVMDLACGTGRHTIPLTKDGINVVGLDSSAHLLKIAQQRGAAKLVRGDLRVLPFKQSSFNAVISMNTSFGYLASEEEDMQSLADVRRVLALGGRFV
jgi:ubiquinone/menaquinone biosynthesis C-methylase UbiE